MRRVGWVAALMMVGLAAGMAVGQEQARPHGAVSTPASGGNSYAGPGDIVYPPVRDPLETRVDMFINDWHNSLPRTEFGSLVLRDILTPGDNYSPPEKGAVLQGANFLSFGRLAPGYETTPSKMDGRQEVYYIVGGKGEITAGGKTAALHDDIAILMPEGLEFTMKNTGDSDLTMYVIDEPTPKAFKPKTQMGVVDERTVAVRAPMEGSPYTLPGASGHWAHVVRDLFNKQDGMATVGDVITVEINPLTMGEPHPHGTNHEEVWVAIDGDSLAFIGNELRVQKPGMAYMLRPDNLEVHSNINYGDKPVKFLWFSGPSVRK